VRFACRPQPDEKEAASALQRVARLTFWLLWIFICGSIYFDTVGDVVLKSDAIAAGESETFLESLLLDCAMVPLVEELMFRSGLKSPPYSMCWGVLAVGVLYYFSFDHSLVAIAIVAIYFTWFLSGLYRRRDSSPRQFVNEYFGLFYPAVFWSYTVAFGFSHIGNFADGVTINNILFIVPHTLTGLVLGYIRIKDGLGYAVVLHGCINYLHENWSFS
jgi:hypothetical protein